MAVELAQDATEGLYRLVDAAHEKRSVAISSNLRPAAFDDLMHKVSTPRRPSTGWLQRRAHVCQTGDESARQTQAFGGHGVSPLN